ncbi:MAG: hypothetical protein NDJ90_15420 [Oligoflexia bacterium]|nr:hypothetical protein [Oligoflexia bacterium]
MKRTFVATLLMTSLTATSALAWGLGTERVSCHREGMDQILLRAEQALASEEISPEGYRYLQNNQLWPVNRGEANGFSCVTIGNRVSTIVALETDSNMPEGVKAFLHQVEPEIRSLISVRDVTG